MVEFEDERFEDVESGSGRELVPVTRDGAVDGESRAGSPVADGGLPTSAGIVPVDASALAEFLDEYGTGPAYRLTYTDEGVERTRLLHDVSMHAVTLERPSAAPAVQCTPLAPGGDTFTVGVADIDRLSVVEPPPATYTEAASTPREEAVALRRLAAVYPNRVDVSSLLTLVEDPNADQFVLRDAVRALRRVASARPEDCPPAVPILRTLLDDEQFVARADAMATMRAIADDDPGAIAPITGELVSQLDATTASARREATKCIAAIAGEFPEDAVDAVPHLATIVEDCSPGREYATYALSLVSRDYPEAVKPVVGTLAEATLDDELADTTRLNATSALGRVVGEYPSVAVDVVDDVVALFDAENHKLRNNAVALVGDVAIVHTDVVEPHTDTIVELVTADDEFTRINATGALSRVARDFPASVDPATSAFIDSLTDEIAPVRENACWALGHLRADQATGALEERARDDEDPDVRARAEWALSQLERRGR